MTKEQKYIHNNEMIDSALDYLDQCRFKPNSKLDKAYQIFNQVSHKLIDEDTDYDANDY